MYFSPCGNSQEIASDLIFTGIKTLYSEEPDGVNTAGFTSGSGGFNIRTSSYHGIIYEFVFFSICNTGAVARDLKIDCNCLYNKAAGSPTSDLNISIHEVDYISDPNTLIGATDLDTYGNIGSLVEYTFFGWGEVAGSSSTHTYTIANAIMPGTRKTFYVLMSNNSADPVPVTNYSADVVLTII